MLYKSLRLLIHLLMSLLARVEIHGIEKLPARGGYIIVANHVGRLEVPLIYHLFNRPDIILLVAEKYGKYAIVRWLVKKLDAIWVDRFNADFRALRQTIERLQRGQVLVIAPEGTRSPQGVLLPGRPGASYLAAKTGLPVIPVAVTGSEDAVVIARLRRLKRARVVVRVGDAFTIPPVAGRQREAILQQHTEEIMCRIAALLPADRRGAYRDHPRLLELLGSAPPA
jgi:1-acyl-sn-glycerol-3-phosphate acyltransferase